ncbi:MAG: HigA family addiction module antidote protein [Acidobacteria bacterium]|nr:HigA family addiction module antidote protein [Acidobacteriota bacterium]
MANPRCQPRPPARRPAPATFHVPRRRIEVTCLLVLCLNQLARDLDVPPHRISGIVNGTRSFTADTALRLGTSFRVSPETWLGLQLNHDLRLIASRRGAEIVCGVLTRPAA